MFIREEGRKFSALLHNHKLLQVILLSFTLAFGILYVIQVNTASTKGFAMRDLERANSQLRLENQQLTSEINRLRSLASVNEREAFLGLIKLSNVKYIKAGNEGVAFK
jgi:cell division protein FtsB